MGLSAGAAAVPAVVKAEDAGGTKAMPGYRKLGRTGLEVSTLSMGSVGGQEVSLFRFAIDRGINFIHTCVNYSGGKSIVNVAKAVEGQRDKLFLGLKCAFSVKDDAGMEDSLKKLGWTMVVIS
ncbi:MAG: hypothetical protein HC901_04075, partial [Bdellovibrionaceae bacterium]|nr:hypothetical protein [Pseudobdellovibrionaceae bacterium]